MRTPWALVLLFGLVRGATAEDGPEVGPVVAPSAVPKRAAERGTPESAADAVVAAEVAKDEAALQALGATDDPDPWLVADELLARGRPELAVRFAAASPRPDTASLPAYVATYRRPDDDARRRDALARAVAAFREGRADDGLAALAGSVPPAVPDVVGVRTHVVRAAALRSLRRHEESAREYAVAAEVAERLGWLADAAASQSGAGMASAERSDLRRARTWFERALALEERLGHRDRIARALGNLGNVDDALGEHDAALRGYARALKLWRELGDLRGEAGSLQAIGVAHEGKGDVLEAMRHYERALEIDRARGDREGIAIDLASLGNAHQELGDAAKALALHREAWAIDTELGADRRAAGALINIGIALASLGEHREALATQEAAFRAKERLGDRAGMARALANMGNVYTRLGDFAKALDHDERALSIMEAIGQAPAVGSILGNIGRVYAALGRLDDARASHARAHEIAERTRDAIGVASALEGLSAVYRAEGDLDQALATARRAYDAVDAKGLAGRAARVSATIGNIHYVRGEHARALEVYERVHARVRREGDRGAEATTLTNIGNALTALGRHAEALGRFERALTLAREIGEREKAAWALCGLAWVHHVRGDPRAAIEFSKQAVDETSTLLGRLPDEQGASLREQLWAVHERGIQAAADAKDVDALAYFLESGRAGTLLEGLGGREAVQAMVVPEELRSEENGARAAESVALAGYRRALASGVRDDLRSRRVELDAARARVRRAIERIQREASAAAAVVYAVPMGITDLRRVLRDGEVFVTYALCSAGALALVVTPRDARVVELGRTERIDEAVAAAFPGSSPGVDVDELASLRRLVVAPLGLPAATRRVLVSPDGRLSYVPFSLLCEGVEVVAVPSATALGRLLAESSLRGDGVLAIGDPAVDAHPDARAVSLYVDGVRGAGGPLSRLPAAAEEATAVGDVFLLDRKATEVGFRAAVATRPRWHAVHFACHGLVDPMHPALSSLALAPTETDDGFLTSLEVFRTKVPADLVVLSGCETGRGRVYRGDGIVGLTRAFMFAGAPRVLCSLWKVDDAATKALMVKFYELWSPRDGSPALPTPAALRAAQAFVASHERWKHPSYWAAWVLWGLPN